MNEYDGGQYCVDRTCGCCGRKFVVERTNFYRYKLLHHGSYVWFCKYTCMEKWRRESEKNLPRRRNGRDVPSLAAIRQYFGFEQREVADFIGATLRTYMQYENAYIKMSLARVEKLASGFGCTVEDITADHFDQSAAAAWVCTIPHLK